MWGSQWRVVAHRAPVNGEFYQNYQTVTQAGGQNYSGIWSIVVPYDSAHGPHPLPGFKRPRGMTVGQLRERLTDLLDYHDVTEDTEVWFGTGLEGDSDEPLSAVYPSETAIWPKMDENQCVPDRWERHEDLQHRLSGVVMIRP